MLARIRKAMEEKDEGFTLIELLVVMIIIGILAAIAIPVFLSQRKKGYEASEKSDLRSIATEISTQAVDQPAAIVLAGTTSVTVTADSNTPGTVALSPGNSLGANSQVLSVANGTYCVALTNNKGGAGWAVYKALAGDAQTLAKGSCSSAGAFVAG